VEAADRIATLGAVAQPHYLIGRYNNPCSGERRR